MNTEIPSLTERLDNIERRLRQLEWNQAQLKDIDQTVDSQLRVEVAK